LLKNGRIGINAEDARRDTWSFTSSDKLRKNGDMQFWPHCENQAPSKTNSIFRNECCKKVMNRQNWIFKQTSNSLKRVTKNNQYLADLKPDVVESNYCKGPHEFKRTAQRTVYLAKRFGHHNGKAPLYSLW